MTTPIYSGHEFDILKVRYEQHAEYLRSWDILEWKILTSFLTVQLILVGWFTEHSLSSLAESFWVVWTDWVLGIICCIVLRRVQIRRREAVETVKNINAAFGLYTKGIYLPDQAINPTPPDAQTYPWYYLSIFVGLIGSSSMLIWRFV